MGDATKDHACWERPEDMDTPRTVIKIDRNTPGSDVAGEAAAALAAASLVFRRSDPTYSKLLVRRAMRVYTLLSNVSKLTNLHSFTNILLYLQKVFAFADRYRGAYSNGLKKFVCPFYCSYSGYQVHKNVLFSF